MENLITVNYDELSYDEFFDRHKKYYNRLIKKHSLFLMDVFNHLEKSGFNIAVINPDTNRKNASIKMAGFLLFDYHYNTSIDSMMTNVAISNFFTKIEILEMTEQLASIINFPCLSGIQFESDDADACCSFGFSRVEYAFKNMRNIGLCFSPVAGKQVDIKCNAEEIAKLFLFGLPYMFCHYIPVYRNSFDEPIKGFAMEMAIRLSGLAAKNIRLP